LTDNVYDLIKAKMENRKELIYTKDGIDLPFERLTLDEEMKYQDKGD
jgi:hypothetical protein